MKIYSISLIRKCRAKPKWDITSFPLGCELIFVCSVKKGPNFISFPCGNPFVSSPFVEKTVCIQLNCLGILVKNQLTNTSELYGM